MTTEPVREKMTLPVVHDVCPVCKSPKRLAASYIQQMKDEGLLHKDALGAGLVHQIPLVDPAHAPTIIGAHIKVKILAVYWDVCECGIMYCTKFDVVETLAQVQMQAPQAPQGFRGSPYKGGR